MNIFKFGLLLLTASSGLAFEIDASCSKDPKWGNLPYRLKLAVKEAKFVLANAAEVAKGCQADISCGQSSVSEQIAGEQEQYCGKAYGDMTRRMNTHHFLETLLGGESIAAWKHIEDATRAANFTFGTSNDQSDGAKIYCGDSAFTRGGPTWTDQDSHRSFPFGYGGNPARPCDTKLKGLAISNPQIGKRGIMLCNTIDESDTAKKRHIFDAPPAKTVGNTWFSGSNQLKSRTKVSLDALSDTLSAMIIHEMIHLGNMEQFPLVIGRASGGEVTEKYKYEECKTLAGSEMKWKNCDTVAIIARGLYMNSFYNDGDQLLLLPEAQLPKQGNYNGPQGLGDRK